MDTVDSRLADMTISELLKLAEVGLRVQDALGTQAEPARQKTPPEPRVATTGVVNTRNPKERAAYDEAVYGYLAAHGPELSSTEIRSGVGGTALQVRTALGRLIEDDRVDYSGQARATRYSIA